MLATLNLQLTTTDLSGESLPLQAFSPADGPTNVGGFAALLDLRVDSLQQQPAVDGQVLPPGGNALPLPEPDIAITVNDLPVSNAAAAAVTNATTVATATTALEVEALLPIEIPVMDQAVVVTAPPVVIPGPITLAATPDESLLPGDVAGLRRDTLPGSLQQLRPDLAQLQQLRPDLAQLQQLRPDLAQLQAEVTPGGAAERPVIPVHPGIAAERQQVAQRRATEAVLSIQEMDPVAENTERPMVAPGAAPVVERLAEAMRTRVRPGQSITAPNGQAQPALFQPLTANTLLSDSNFASTLQQQATDLIRTPVTEPAWGERIGERVIMLAGNQLKSAEIRLTPAELGPVRVQVSVEDGAANVTFQAQNAVTREALEQALPRLREMLAESGLSLGQADVGEHGVSQGDRDCDTEAATPGTAGDDAGTLTGDAETADAGAAAVTSKGLVDTFA